MAPSRWPIGLQVAPVEFLAEAALRFLRIVADDSPTI